MGFDMGILTNPDFPMGIICIALVVVMGVYCAIFIHSQMWLMSFHSEMRELGERLKKGPPEPPKLDTKTREEYRAIYRRILQGGA